MNEERKVTLRYLIDMYNGIFDDDIIAAVLEQRDWNTDRALDDLSAMAEGCSFELPVDEVAEPLTSNFHSGDPLSQQIQFGSYTNSNDNETEEKAESEDDIIVVNEEEFCIPAESESEDEKSPSPERNKVAPTQLPSYASIAKKPPTYVEISRNKPPAILFTGYTSFDRKKRTRDSLERVKLFVREGFKIMVILRGCAGSGKSTLAKNILADCNLTKNSYWYIHSADNYFHLNDQGTYQRDAAEIATAQKWNQVNVLHVVREGLTPVIIDNTNTRMWEMEVYAAMAVCAGYEIEVVEPDTPWAFHTAQLVRKNTHRVGKEQIMQMLERYEYNISSSLLIKSKNLDYAPGMAPPQVGVRELSNQELISLFEDLYNAIHVFPQQLKALKKQNKPKKPSRKARKKQRAVEDKTLDEIVNAIENCGETENGDESLDDIDVTNPVVQSFAANDLTESDSDKSWEDMTSDSYASVLDESQNTSDESDDDENDDESSDSESSSSSSDSDEISIEVDETVAAELAPIDNVDDSGNDEKEENPESMNSVNTMVDSMKNPMGLGANEVSVELTDRAKNKFANRLYANLSKNVPRLKCFENFHGSDDEMYITDDDIVEVSDPSIIQSVTKIIDEPISPIEPSFPPDTKYDSSDDLAQKILNNALPPIDKVPNISDIVAEVINAPVVPSPTTELLESIFTNDLTKSASSTINDTGFSEASELQEWRRSDDVLSQSGTFACIEGKIFDASSLEPFTTANDSVDSSIGTPEVTVIYNEPDKLIDSKSNKSLKNLNAGNSTEDDRNSLLDEAKRITGTVDPDTSLSYKNNLNEGDNSPVGNRDQVVSSSKFKDEGDASSLIRSIENDLWGDSFEDNTHVADADRNRGSENSENSDYGSNSSSSDELRMEDIHNSVNRFVNNDINSEPSSEKKKPNINQFKDKNAVDDEGITWNVDSTVELNTLKERILVSSLDKVFNQVRITEDETEGEIKTINISRKSSITGFQLIENKLNEKSEVNVERNESFDEYAPRDDTETLDTDRTESKFWNQWMKGDNWDEPKEEKETKSTESKPPRKHESPSKQKNTETSSIRLVNDIKTSTDKNTNHPKMKSINFEPIMNDYFKYRSYPNAEDSLFGLPAAYDAKLKNVNVNDSKDSYYAMNPMPKRVNDEGSDDGEKKNTWAFPDNSDHEASSYVDARRSPYRNFPNNYDIDLQFLEKQEKDWPSSDKNTTKNDDQVPLEPKPNRRVKKKVEDKTPEFVDELVQRWKSIAKEETPPDYDKVLKWSPLNDVEVEWNSDDNRFVSKPANDEKKPQRVIFSEMKSNFFIPQQISPATCDQTTNTGTDDIAEDEKYREAYCREINDDRESPVVCSIEQKMRCDKSTMTEGSSYTVKAKPIKEDLLNMFPKDMADSILDLYEKCNGNMDWIIEILLEDGYSPTDNQLEYLSSLQNVVNFENDVAIEKDKPVSEKKKKSNGNGKNIRRNNSHFEENKEPVDFSKKIKRKKIDLRDEKQQSPDYEYPANVFNGEVNDDETEGSVELFLDTTTVQQLVGHFGNPTVYSLKDCQPVINLPVSLARQIHAYLLESVIDQAEMNESLINQFAEEEIMSSQIQSMELAPEVTQNDMIEVENSLLDVFSNEAAPSATSEDSFASKLSLDLLFKSFPTVDPSFVLNTFRSNKCNYYETKKVLNQIREEVPTNLTFNLNDETRLVDQIRTKDEPLFESTSMPRTEVLEQANSYRDGAAFNYSQWQKFNEQLKTAIQRKRYGVAPYYRELMGAFKQKYDECNAKAAAVLINSCCFNNSNVIDLHFFKVTEALRALDIFLDHHISRLANAARPKITLYIITGRGARNGDGVSHLQPPVKARLKKRNIEFEVQPSNTGLVIAVVRKSSLMTHDL